MSVEVIHVLLVEDNPGDAFLIQERLKQSIHTRFKVTAVETLKDAIGVLDQTQFEIILLDLSLPDSQGLDTFLSVAEQANHLPIVVLTGLKDEEMAMQAVRLGAQDYLTKGLVIGELLVHALRYAIERKRTQEQLKQQKIQLEIANQELESRTQQLEMLNTELEAFSYTVSHDLRNPLVGIDGYSCFLEKRYESQLDQTGKTYIHKIRKGVKRMNQLIDDLLELSCVQNSQMTIETVDLTAIVLAIVQDLQQQHPARNIEFKITPNIQAKGDNNLLKIALENLLGNAFKYTEKNQKTCIEFGVLKSIFSGNIDTDSSFVLKKKLEKSGYYTPLFSEKTIYFIRDNGVGFDMGKVDKLFTPFQRLHSSSEFKGTGVGLATVQRIIHRHHGRIWAESIKEKGATFYFTLNPDVSDSQVSSSG